MNQQIRMRHGRLAGRKARVVTGVSDLGHAAALALAREGADVAIGYPPGEETQARDVAQVLCAQGRSATPLPGALGDEASCARLVADAVRALDGLDILVSDTGAFLRRSTEPPGSSFETDVCAMVWITKAALAHLGSGSFLVYAVSADSGGSPATKAATASFAKGLASQLAGNGIRVDVLAPETPGRFWPPSDADTPLGVLRPTVEPNSA